MRNCLRLNGRKGVYGELVAATFLQQQGYDVFLSVGSHGPADMIAMKGKERRAFDVKMCRTTRSGQPRKDKSLKLTAQQKRMGIELILVTQDGEVAGWDS